MTIEDQIASLNDNVGTLVSKSDQLTTAIETKLNEYETWKESIHKSNPVILQVGADKEFTHPVDAINHINSHNLAGDIFWKIEIDPGIYEFPHNGVGELKFSHFKYVQIIGNTTNSSDVIFKHISNNHVWLIIGERNSHIDVRNISFMGDIDITKNYIQSIRDRSLRSGMSGGGLSHGILARHNSSFYVKNCNFNKLWHAIHCHDNCNMTIDDITASNIYGGAHATANCRIYITRSVFQGIGSGVYEDTSWAGLASFHNSSIFCYGMEIKDFHVGLYCHWSSDFHFHRAYDYDSDGVTKINIKDGLIENCYHGIHTWYYSGGNINNSLVKNSQNNAIVVGQSSNIHALENIIVDGAEIGYYVSHTSILAANGSIARNCRNIGYYSAHKSELHASNTTSNLSGNAVNYSPAISHSLANSDSYIYIS
jgi:hypothetical protein